MKIADESAKIQEKKSRADIKLKEIEQQLQSAERTCDYIKKRLNYMKLVYENSGFISFKGFISSSAKSSNSVVSTNQEFNLSPTNEREMYFNAMSNGENCKEDTKAYYSSTSKTSSPRSITVYDNKYFSIYKNESQTKDNISEEEKSSVVKMTSEVFSDKRLFDENICEEKMSNSTNESSSNSHNFENFKGILEPEEIFKPFPPTAKSNKKSQLILKINAARREFSKRHKIKKTDKTAKTLSYLNLMINKKSEFNKRHEDICQVMKMKQRKAKLKKTNSESTEAKNHAFIYPENKNKKKYKRRGLINRKIKASQVKSNTKHQEKITIIDKNESIKDVIEIYHNAATKNTSPSIASSKHYFELENKRNTVNLKQDQNSVQLVQDGVENPNSLSLNYINSLEREFHGLDLKEQLCEADAQDTFSSSTKNRKKKRSHKPQDEDHHDEDCHSTPAPSYCCELTSTVRNYEQPTIASKLKRVDRCYLATKFNLKNIPFIVGTSVTPSHNIGLNIQQVLSLMKTKQHQLMAEFQPELMNKAQKTFDPIMQSLLETLNINSANIDKNPTTQSKQLFYQNTCKQENNTNMEIGQSDGLVKPKPRKQQITHSFKNSSVNVKITKNKNSSTNYQNFSSTGTFENAVRKLYNRFDALNEKFEHLQNQLKKSNDENLKKELIQVENELNEKEEEINAIVGLYSEIISLKRQIKMQHKNSLLYITTSCSTHNSTKINSSIIERPQNSHTLHISEYQQPKTLISKKIPSTARLFVGLLRHIQSIQHQLTTI